MPKHSISEAARLAGVSRSHFYKKFIRPGVISVEKDKDDNPVIDTSEIVRVFGRIQGDTGNAVSGIQNDTPQNDSKNAALEAENRVLREQLAAAAEREKWMQGKIDQLADQLASTTRLLEHKEVTTAEKEKQIKEQQGQLNVYRKESLWKRLLGRETKA